MRHAARMGGARVVLSSVFAADVGRSVRAVFGEIAAFLFHGVASDTSLDQELREVAEPHLAILIHKRTRYLTPDDGGAVRSERWTKELDDFVSRAFFWPTLAPTKAFGKWDRRQIAQKLDRIVAEEQRRDAAAPAALPMTSRFGSSWAD